MIFSGCLTNSSIGILLYFSIVYFWPGKIEFLSVFSFGSLTSRSVNGFRFVLLQQSIFIGGLQN